jgi:putative endonuclease
VSSRQTGQALEARVASFLKKQGLEPVDKNYRCRFGEVDLIMREGNVLVFIEVRGRRGERFGSPAESVTRPKQRRVAAAAAHYLQRHARLAQLACRFDVVGVDTSIEPPGIRWIKSAFDA